LFAKRHPPESGSSLKRAKCKWRVASKKQRLPYRCKGIERRRNVVPDL
jgi:hypothetical protein